VFEYPDWVSVLSLTAERDVVLIRRYRHGIRRTILDLPGGAVDEGDASILAAAQRELLD
jgi:ADP-ribose pyrophosphatase